MIRLIKGHINSSLSKKRVKNRSQDSATQQTAAVNVGSRRPALTNAALGKCQVRVASAMASYVWHTGCPVWAEVAKGEPHASPDDKKRKKRRKRKSRLSQRGCVESQQDTEEFAMLCSTHTKDLLETDCAASQVIIETTHILLRNLGQKSKHGRVTSATIEGGTCLDKPLQHSGARTPNLSLEEIQLFEGSP